MPRGPARRSSARSRSTSTRAAFANAWRWLRRAGATLMIGFNRRFDPSFSALARRLRAGEIGAVEIVTILSRDPAPPPAEHAAWSGGLFRDMMIHDLDMARFLLGEEPVEVHAVGACLVDPAIGDAGDVDTAAVLLKTASGRIAQISNSRRAAYGYDQRIEVHGSTGLLSAGNRQATTVTQGRFAGYRDRPGAAVLPRALRRGLSGRARRVRCRSARRGAGFALGRGRPAGADPGRRRDRGGALRQAGAGRLTSSVISEITARRAVRRPRPQGSWRRRRSPRASGSRRHRPRRSRSGRSPPAPAARRPSW